MQERSVLVVEVFRSAYCQIGDGVGEEIRRENLMMLMMNLMLRWLRWRRRLLLLGLVVMMLMMMVIGATAVAARAHIEMLFVAAVHSTVIL